ncbi:MAG: leucyl-tRNA synthetase [Paraglaciecola sp.]|jgi:leucyl-tRNA synthetase
MEYTPRTIEKKWRQFWDENQTYKVSNDSDKPKFYVLDMFPYPSGSGLHVGHPLGYIASDIYSRYKRLNGFNVLHPMGYDAFGLPAEQYAIQTGVHPAKSTAENIKRYRDQLDNLGFSYDWSREVQTSNPKYYKFTQWIFIQLFEHWYDTEQQKARPITELEAHFAEHGTEGLHAACSEDSSFIASDWSSFDKKMKADTLMNCRLAYRTKTFVNWCEELGTVLANDEVKDGVSERGGYPVERRPMLQWSLRITAYAERLLSSLDKLEWSDSMKKVQANWIGRSTGAQLFFDLDGHDEQIEIYTTRPDTIFGATFMVLAPEHDLVAKITTKEEKKTVQKYLDYVNTRSERDRQAESKDVSGAFTGAYALNPFNGAKIPVFIGEYVLKDYGTGAIMAVPADDERDKRFADKFGCQVVSVIDKSMHEGATIEDKVGTMINSEFLNGMQVLEAIQKVNKRIEEQGIGKAKVNFRLRDAIYSRQRYWGEPFPIQYDEDGIAHAMKVEYLPLELPELDDFKPASGAKSPLARNEAWVNFKEGWTRETDTMPGFAGSSWYFLRYMDVDNEEAFAGQAALNYWQDVDLYVGGTEHAVGHLLYSRFWHKFLFDKGLVPTNEPFKKLINQGMIQGIVESLYMLKDKEDGIAKFVCAGLVEKGIYKNVAKIPIHVDFVQNYGAEDSHLNMDSIKQFLDWRPEYKDAVFVCGNGIYQKGQFSSKNGEKDSRLFTHSEVGKMSKRWFNVVNPDDVVEKYGADCFRMYEMFLGPIEQSKPWNTKGIDGVSKFLGRFWNMFYNDAEEFLVKDEVPSKEALKILHTCIKKITTDVERFSFNTCISGFMVCVKDLRNIKCNNKAILQELVVLMAPFAPHISEELWHKLGNETSVNIAEYPVVNEAFLKEDAIDYPISINGKKRAMANFSVDASKEEIEKAALAMPEVQKWTEGKTVRKVIVVPKRMVNIVVG